MQVFQAQLLRQKNRRSTKFLARKGFLMKKSLMAFVLALALAASAFAAPRAGDLTVGVTDSGNWIGIGIRDVDAFLNAQEGSLLSRALKLAPVTPDQLGKVGAVDVRATAKEDMDKIEKFVMAFDLKAPVTLEDINIAGNAKAADFTVTAPEGMKLTPLCVADGGEEVGKINMALLERDGKQYLLAANGDPAVLAAMAAAPENNAGVTVRTPANLWVQAHLTKDFVKANGSEVPEDLDVELGIEDTATSVKLTLWSNIVDELNGVLGKDLRAVLNGGAQKNAPVLFGKAPLAAILNLSASFLPENFKLADLMPAEEAAEAEKQIVAQISQVGFTWEDLVKQLRGNITIGFAGKFTAPMVGEIPGLFINATGVDLAKIAPLVEMGAQQLGGMIGKAEPYEADGWKGYKFSGMASGLIVTGEKGVLVAAMNADQFGALAEVVPGLAAAVEPRNFALGLNTAELQPVLKKIFADHGDTLLQMGGEEAMQAKGIIQQIIDNMNMVDAVSLVAADENTLVLEVTPNAGLVNMVLPAPETAPETAPAEEKPAA